MKILFIYAFFLGLLALGIFSGPNFINSPFFMIGLWGTVIIFVLDELKAICPHCLGVLSLTMYNEELESEFTTSEVHHDVRIEQDVTTREHFSRRGRPYTTNDLTTREVHVPYTKNFLVRMKTKHYNCSKCGQDCVKKVKDKMQV